LISGPTQPAIDSATYNISFFYSATAFGASSATLASNLGAPLANWGTFSVSGSLPATLVFAGSAFTYDPSLGDLLMQTTVLGLTVRGPRSAFFKADDSGADTLRNYSINGLNFANLNRAPVVTFDGRSLAVPEPTGLALAGLGLGLALLMRRRPG
jgi:hypothetical protein